MPYGVPGMAPQGMAYMGGLPPQALMPGGGAAAAALGIPGGAMPYMGGAGTAAAAAMAAGGKRFNITTTEKIFRELHIGNIPPGISGEQLQSFMNAAMTQGGLITSPGMCIRQVRCNPKFAFAEFRSVDETNNALNLNEIVLMGRQLKLARPRGYTGPNVPFTPWPQWMGAKLKQQPELEGKIIGIAAPSEVVVMASSLAGGGASAPDRPMRELYVGNLPDSMQGSGAVLGKFIQAAMTQTKLTDDPQCIVNVRVAGRFAFVEFKAPVMANRALNLTGIEMSGSKLRINRPKTYTGPDTHSVTWNELLQLGIGAVEAGATGAVMPSMPTFGGFGGPVGGSLVGGAGGGRKPCRALQLSNMVTQEDLNSDEEFGFLAEDVATEMAKYAAAANATVEELKIPRGTIGEPGVGHIYVMFSNLEAAVQAQLQLPMRKFGEEFIKATFYDEEMLKAGETVDIAAHDAKQQKEKAAAVAQALGAGFNKSAAPAAAAAPAPASIQPPGPVEVLGGGGARGMAPARVQAGPPEVLGGGGGRGQPAQQQQQQQRMPMGRGRGRGRTLPAWMTQ